MSYSLIVKQGNLLHEKATFIVNTSNSKLILGSGVSMAFKRHCGVELQEEMYQVLKKIDEPLYQGDVVATSSGKATNFTYALHAVIMNYNTGIRGDKKKPTLQVLEIALKNIEKYLIWHWENNKQLIRLALPLMGCGVGGLNKDDVIELYRQYFSREVSFDCEVIIYCRYAFNLAIPRIITWPACA